MSGDIEFLVGVAAVRKRPGMYVGPLDAAGLESMLEEIVANSVDQHLAGHATLVELRLRPDGATIRDDGEGFPIDQPAGLATVTTLHAQATADGHAPHVHLPHSRGIGISAVGALCARMSIRAWRSGRLFEMVVEQGVVTAAPRMIGTGTERGTTVDMVPDPEIFGNARIRRAVVRARLFHAAHLFPGLRVMVDDEVFLAPGGLADYLAIEDASMTSHRPIRVPFSHTSHAAEMWLTAAATGQGDPSLERTRWQSWANGQETVQHGAHVDGFRAALRAVGWHPTAAAIHVALKHPLFDGPTKDRLHSAELARAIERILREPLAAHVDSLRR